MNILYTFGHSNHSLEKFLQLLNKYHITVVGDIRSHPHSKHCPHFNYAFLQRELPKNNLRYCFWGKELGGRPDDPRCYDNHGQVQYSSLINTPAFQVGLSRLKQLLVSYPVVLMCTERDPLNCHRSILIGRYLREFTIKHILANGDIETQPEIEQRLLNQYNSLQQPSLFNQNLKDAYDLHSQKVAYSQPNKKLVVREEENRYGKNSTVYHRFYEEISRGIF